MLRIRNFYPGSWILIFTHPGSRSSDPGSKNSNKREGWKKICCHTFLCSHKFHKIENHFIFLMLKKKIWASFQRIIELFTQKLVTSSKKYGVGIRDPRSGIRYPEKNHIISYQVLYQCNIATNGTLYSILVYFRDWSSLVVTLYHTSPGNTLKYCIGRVPDKI